MAYLKQLLVQYFRQGVPWKHIFLQLKEKYSTHSIIVAKAQLHTENPEIVLNWAKKVIQKYEPKCYKIVENVDNYDKLVYLLHAKCGMSNRYISKLLGTWGVKYLRLKYKKTKTLLNSTSIEKEKSR